MRIESGMNYKNFEKDLRIRKDHSEAMNLNSE